MKPTKDAIAEALKFPNAYVYVIDKEYDKKKEVPPTAIKGAWKTNETGFTSVPAGLSQRTLRTDAFLKSKYYVLTVNLSGIIAISLHGLLG